MPTLQKLYAPQSVAVIGASAAPHKVGHAVLHNLIQNGYQGRIYPINPKEQSLEGIPCYRSVAELPETPDVAVFAIPREVIVPVVEECGQKGVPFGIVLTAGFREVGQEGAALEQALMASAAKYGMHIVGPNCLGVMDTHTPLNASFAYNFPLKGEIAFFSQSGALLAAILDWSLQRGVGFSKFVSMGNKADLTETDYILDAASDPYTKVICCYVEAIDNGPRFVEVVSEASRHKPVIILKAGITSAGARAASSHTGALAGSDRAYETAFRQAGVLRARSLDELFYLATAFASQPVPKGDRVAVLTNGGGAGIIATDAIETHHLTMASLAKETVDALRPGLPAEASLYNPVDVIGDATWERYDFALGHILKDPNVDALLVLVVEAAMTQGDKVAEAILKYHGQYPEKPVTTAYLGGASVEKTVDRLNRAGIPSYNFPEPAVAALAGLARYRQWLDAPAPEKPPEYAADRELVRAVFKAVRDDHRLVLLGSEASRVAEAYGLGGAPVRLAQSPEEAVRYAEELGYPVVLKVASPKIVHKSDVGGVRLGLRDADAVRKAYLDILDSVQRSLPGIAIYGLEVQHMAPPGRELIVGMTRDVQFGPLIMFGLGGTWVNLIEDVTFRLAQGLDRRQIEAMMHETRAYRLLRGYRGEPPADVDAVAAAIGRVAMLVRDFPEIAEMDINPLVAYPHGVAALDVKITLGS